MILNLILTYLAICAVAMIVFGILMIRLVRMTVENHEKDHQRMVVFSQSVDQLSDGIRIALYSSFAFSTLWVVYKLSFMKKKIYRSWDRRVYRAMARGLSCEPQSIFGALADVIILETEIRRLAVLMFFNRIFKRGK